MDGERKLLDGERILLNGDRWSRIADIGTLDDREYPFTGP